MQLDRHKSTQIQNEKESEHENEHRAMYEKPAYIHARNPGYPVRFPSK